MKKKETHKRLSGNNWYRVSCGLFLYKFAGYIRIYINNSKYWGKVTCENCLKMRKI